MRLSRANLKFLTLATMTMTSAAAAQSVPAGGQDGPVADPQESGIQDIVVTAQRRSERLQEVPLSITALSGDQLEGAGILSTTDLTNITPGLVWARSTAFSQPTIRGIGSRNASIGDEPNVAVYLDGVYQPEQFATIFELANIERVEVLKGPQGTLFGRNATGGAVNIITKNPSFATEGSIDATYGEFDYMKLSGYVSGPLVGDTIAASLTGVFVRDDGYIRNVFLDSDQGKRKSAALRGKLLFKLSPDAEIIVAGHYSRGSDNVNFSHHPLNGNTRARITPNPLNIPQEILIPTGDFQTATQFVPYAKTRQHGVDARLNVDLGGAALTVVTAYQRNKAHVLSESDGSPLPIAFNQDSKFTKAYIAEAILSSDGDGPLRWVAGVNGFVSNAFQLPNNSNGTLTNTGQKTRSASGFGELTYAIADRLFLTGGLRVTYDQKRSFNQPVTTGVITSAKTSSTDISPRAVVRYEVTEATNVYASFSRGFKSATFNPLTVAGALTPARPEKVDAFEVGIKSDPLPNLRINAAAFYYDYRNLQVTVTNLLGGGIVTALENAPKATIKGLEATAEVALARNLKLTLGASYLHTNIDEFPNASVTVPNIVNGLPSGNISVSRNVSGNDLIRAPRFTFNVGLDYDTPLAGGELTISANALFSDRYYTDVLNRLFQPAYEQVNASVTWAAPGDRFHVTVFGQNLTDDRVISQLFTSTINDVIAYQKPRWFGATLGYDF